MHRMYVLVSNWQHYAHLIEPQGTGDQNEEEKFGELHDTLWRRADKSESTSESSLEDPNARLMHGIAGAAVNVSNHRYILALCVLPNLDSRFDDNADIHLPTLDLGYFSSEAGQRLKYFQISVEADTQNYIKCLYCMTKISAPAHSTVKRLYEDCSLASTLMSALYGNFGHSQELKMS
jgi:hypothetical protein